MNKRRIKTKYRTVLPKNVKRMQELEKITKKNVSKVNQKIKSIRKKYKGSEFTWSITNIKNLLPKYFKKDKIKIPKKPSEIELLDIYKQTKKFLGWKTSTKAGINETKEKAKETLKQTLADEGFSVTNQDITDYYSMFEDNDFNSFIKDTGLQASEVWAIMDDSIRSEDSENQFLSRLGTFITIQDEDIRNRAIRLYNKYVL